MAPPAGRGQGMDARAQKKNAGFEGVRLQESSRRQEVPRRAPTRLTGHWSQATGASFGNISKTHVYIIQLSTEIFRSEVDMSAFP